MREARIGELLRSIEDLVEIGEGLAGSLRDREAGQRPGIELFEGQRVGLGPDLNRCGLLDGCQQCSRKKGYLHLKFNYFSD